MTKTKKILAFMTALSMMTVAFTACGVSSDSAEEETTTTVAETEAETETEADNGAEPATDGGGFEEAVEAQSGDAYLAMVDGQWYVQYWGTADDLLTYDAGVATITGDGEYTVSVNAATAGMMYDITGDANGEYTPAGMSFMAVIVKDGTTLYPNMSIEVTSVKIDGQDIDMSAKNYTSSDDGVEMRANLYNEWVTELPEDAHDANGVVTDASTYSAQVVSPDDFNAGWTTIEVTFNVTGIDG